MQRDQLLSHLGAIGFTDYEAKVYLALLQAYPTTGYQLSKNGGIPRSMVYEALGRLEIRGAVLKTEEDRAALYRPLPPDILLDQYIEQSQQHANRIREGLRSLYKVHEEDHLWTVRGQTAVYAYVCQMIDNAKSEVFLVLGDEELEITRKKISEAADKGVQINTLLTELGDLDIGNVAYHPPLESQLQELDHMLVVVVDKKEVLIASKTPEPVATVTTNRNLVMIARQFVWMEMFAQRVYAQISPELLHTLAPEDQAILSIYTKKIQ